MLMSYSSNGIVSPYSSLKMSQVQIFLFSVKKIINKYKIREIKINLVLNLYSK
ncbi:uncharacterized protein DS421_9g254690 [Arachis hypogaea]|nr:uncharacterized protein DS421_9g254690 [Arachis hypogaea]